MKCAICLIEAINQGVSPSAAKASLPQYPPAYLHSNCNRAIGAVDAVDPSRRLPCSSARDPEAAAVRAEVAK
jgi:hypothetical protein